MARGGEFGCRRLLCICVCVWVYVIGGQRKSWTRRFTVAVGSPGSSRARWWPVEYLALHAD